MQYYRATLPETSERDPHLLATDGEELYDLTCGTTELQSVPDLATVASVTGSGLDEVAAQYCTPETALQGVEIAGDEAGSLDRLHRPVVPSEVWAAGVTYEISEEAREDESSLPEIYREVYEAERPEIFFKATPSRTVGPGDAVGVRADSDWNVPEPELGIVLFGEEIIGYTVGNDVSSRAIEGANPLYLPQAKVYDRCCALGPCVASTETVGDPHDLTLSMSIERGEQTIYEDQTTTAKLARTVEELTSYYTRHNPVPQLSVLLTGTSLVPSEEFTLTPEDEVTIRIENVGVLQNTVQRV